MYTSRRSSYTQSYCLVYHYLAKGLRPDCNTIATSVAIIWVEKLSKDNFGWNYKAIWKSNDRRSKVRVGSSETTQNNDLVGGYSDHARKSAEQFLL